MAIMCITGSIQVNKTNKMIKREYLTSAKEWTLELFSKRVLSLRAILHDKYLACWSELSFKHVKLTYMNLK